MLRFLYAKNVKISSEAASYIEIKVPEDLADLAGLVTLEVPGLQEPRAPLRLPVDPVILQLRQDPATPVHLRLRAVLAAP
jgi:hypothetical protein